MPTVFRFRYTQLAANERDVDLTPMLKKLLAGVLKVWKLPHFSPGTHFSEALLLQDFIYHGLRNFQNWR